MFFNFFYCELGYRKKTFPLFHSSCHIWMLTIYCFLHDGATLFFISKNDIILTHFSPVLSFIQKSIIFFVEQNTLLVSIWNATLSYKQLLSHNTCKAKTRDTQEKAVAKNREWSRAEPGKCSDFDLSERHREAISLKTFFFRFWLKVKNAEDSHV